MTTQITTGSIVRDTFTGATARVETVTHVGTDRYVDLVGRAGETLAGTGTRHVDDVVVVN